MLWCAAFAIIALIGGSLEIWAELPPDAYKSYQYSAAEALTIKVKSVQIVKRKEDGGTRWAITAEAQVESVTRSASGLRPGDSIRISYSHLESKEPIAGPSEPDILQEGRTYPAFLAKSNATSYTIAVAAASFRSLN